MSTSSTVAFYKGYYAGGTPTVLSANPFDVAQDLSTGNLWQYTGGAWVAPSWQTSITFWLGAADTVCARLNSPDTKIPSTIQVYYGTADQVPPELNLSADDVAIHHGIGNYNLVVNVLRRDVTTDTVVDVPFPEGYIISTDDGNWTIIKNFTKCVGYDYATVSLAWTTTADGTGPQSVDYVTSGAVTSMIESAIGSGGTVSGALISGSAIDTTVGSNNLQFDDRGFAVVVQGSGDEASNLISLQQGVDEDTPDGYRWITIDNNNISLNANRLDTDAPELGYYHTASLNVSTGGISADTTGSIKLETTHVTADEETVVSNALVVSRDTLTLGCDDPDLGEWSAYFDTQYIYIGVNGISLMLNMEGVTISSDCVVSGNLATSAGLTFITSDGEGGTTIATISNNLGVVELDGNPIATQPWVTSQISGISAGITSADASSIASSVISSGGYVTSQYVSSATSGAIVSGAEIDTVVGGYRLTYTSSGGLAVSGGGAQFQVSSDGIVASGASGESVILSGGSVTAAVNETTMSLIEDGFGVQTPTESMSFDGYDLQVRGLTVATENYVNSQGFLEPLHTAIDSMTTAVVLSDLAGGTSYIYTQPLTEFSVLSVVNTTVEDRIQFTLTSGGQVTFPASCGLCPSGFTFEGGKSYLVAVMGGNVIAAEYQPGVLE